MNWFYGFLVIALTLIVHDSICEVYTSIAEMKDVVVLETNIIDAFQKYSNLERARLELINSCMRKYKENGNKALKNVDGFLENPLNVYLLIKRLTADLEKIESLVRSKESDSALVNLQFWKNNSKFPKGEDLLGTVVALTRLQETYAMDTASVARGELNKIKYDSELSASDCFEIGKQCYKNNDFQHARTWLLEAETRFDAEDEDRFSERSYVLEYAILTAYKLSNISLTLNNTNTLLQDIQSGNTTTPILPSEKWPFEEEYRIMCQGNTAPPVELLSKMHCRYLNNNNPFLKIAPFKSEEVSLHPRIILFHDVISDKEVETIKELALARFDRALVASTVHGKNVPSLSRIGKVAWLLERLNKTVVDINRRFSHMSGLTTKTAEPLQISNYGIGGHFVAHWDYAAVLNGSIVGRRGRGNRVATMILYMSDVEQGGATVFTEPKVTIQPRKGLAALWFNLHPNGDGDNRTMHGGCPVIIGSKWVSNKWFYEHGQEFRRPCELTRLPSDLPMYT